MRFVRCPAEHRDEITCANCGGRKGPLCARKRDYVVYFTPHGAKQNTLAEGGGCYAWHGRTRGHWEHTAESRGKTILPDNEPERLVRWAKALPPGTRFRHHIAGDVGIGA